MGAMLAVDGAGGARPEDDDPVIAALVAYFRRRQCSDVAAEFFSQLSRLHIPAAAPAAAALRMCGRAAPAHAQLLDALALQQRQEGSTLPAASPTAVAQSTCGHKVPARPLLPTAQQQQQCGTTLPAATAEESHGNDVLLLALAAAELAAEVKTPGCGGGGGGGGGGFVVNSDAVLRLCRGATLIAPFKRSPWLCLAGVLAKRRAWALMLLGAHPSTVSWSLPVFISYHRNQALYFTHRVPARRVALVALVRGHFGRCVGLVSSES